MLHLNDKLQAKGRWGEPEVLKALEWYDTLKTEQEMAGTEAQGGR